LSCIVSEQTWVSFWLVNTVWPVLPGQVNAVFLVLKGVRR